MVYQIIRVKCEVICLTAKLLVPTGSCNRRMISNKAAMTEKESNQSSAMTQSKSRPLYLEHNIVR